MTCTIRYDNGTSKKVKNLRWLLEHWREVSQIDITEASDGGAEFYAMLKHSILYTCKGARPTAISFETPFASYSIACNFVNRPVFKGLLIKKHPLPMTNDQAEAKKRYLQSGLELARIMRNNGTLEQVEAAHQVKQSAYRQMYALVTLKPGESVDAAFIRTYGKDLG